MSDGTGTRKWILVIGVVALLIGAWQAVSCMGKTKTVDVGVVCTGCSFHGPMKVPVGSTDWPTVCPKCGERKAYVSRLCPKCSKPIAWDPKSPPTTCPLCKAKLVDDTL